ncbi:MAG: hypothetical protein VCB99_09200, partial [Myxococcota bacterium]
MNFLSARPVGRNTTEDLAPPVLARALEYAGFESLWFGEHRHIPMSRKFPYPAGGALPEPYKKTMAASA